MKNIFAFTDPSAVPSDHQVGYMNLSEDDQGVAVLTVRSEGQAGHCDKCGTGQPVSASVFVPDAQLDLLVTAIELRDVANKAASSGMPAHQVRAIHECEELKYRMDKLEAFIVSAPFYELAAEDQFLMRQQFTYMHGYLSCLEQRIARFPKPEVPAGSPGATL